MAGIAGWTSNATRDNARAVGWCSDFYWTDHQIESWIIKAEPQLPQPKKKKVNQNVLLFLVLVSTLVIVSQLALGVWLMIRARYYRGLAQTERIRLQIGDARCRSNRTQEWMPDPPSVGETSEKPDYPIKALEDGTRVAVAYGFKPPETAE